MTRHHLRRRAAPDFSVPGFTGIELLVAVVILGVLAAIGVASSLAEFRAARVDAAANEFVGWLEAVRRAAERGIPCDVTITTQTNADSTTTAASAAASGGNTTIPNNCLSSNPFLIQSARTADRYAVTASTTAFTFTPRGSLFGTDLIEIRFQAVENGAAVGSSRCVRLNPPLGLIDVGVCTLP